MSDDRKLQLLMLALLDVTGPIEQKRWFALSYCMTEACENDLDLAIGIVRQARAEYLEEV